MIVSRTRLARSASFVLVLAAGAQVKQPIHAACLPPPPPCEALQKASIVVLVDVLETASGQIIAPHPLPPQTARLRVIERFKGVTEEQREASANIWLDSESVMLKAGRTFLVYANQMEGRPQDLWNTGAHVRKTISGSTKR